MDISITNISVNNNINNGNNFTLVAATSPIISWTIETTKVNIYQLTFEIRIGTHTVHWGKSSFSADIVRATYEENQSKQWRFENRFISRGTKYYGQLRVKSSTGQWTHWSIFSLEVVRLPLVLTGNITPIAPSENDDLVLKYSLSDTNSDVSIKWFRNGINHVQFNDFTKISKEYMRYLDVWSAEITPLNHLEHGPIFDVDAITVQKQAPAASDVIVLPDHPNDNDILEASYTILDPSTNNVLVDDKSKIEWFVSGNRITEADNNKFVRFKLKPNDQVFYIITPSDGQFDGSRISSNVVTISDSGFKVSSLLVDGSSNNINVKSVNPNIEWSVIEPFNRTVVYAKIQIGSVSGSNDVYENLIQTSDTEFTIPNNLLTRGIDYYISVSVGDTPDTLGNVNSTHFRIVGNLWEQSVNNVSGWTLEISAKVSGTDYQKISIADGSYFAEIRLYESRIDLLLDNSIILTYNIDLTKFTDIIIGAKGTTLKIFESNSLIIDASNRFIQPTTDRFIEIGSTGDSQTTGFFKKINYSVVDFYDPTQSSIYSDIHLLPFVSFIGSTVDCLEQYQGDVLAGVNPRNSTESGNIYRITETGNSLFAATENVDNFDVKINSATLSSNESFSWFLHSRGASRFSNYDISQFDIDSRFLSGFKPEDDNWQLISTTPFNAISFISDGIVIDTTFANTSRDDTRVLFKNKTVSGIRLTYRYDTLLMWNFDVQITTTDLVIRDANTLVTVFDVPLHGKRIKDVINAINTSEDEFLRWVIRASEVNEVGLQQASNLLQTPWTNIFKEVELKGNFKVVDPYDPNPYLSTSGGKWFYTHRRHGTPWFDRVRNDRGWTVDFDLVIDAVEDIDRPSNTDGPEGMGLYLNDGSYYETIYFMPQEIIFTQANRSFLCDTTTLNRYRITGKNKKLKIWVKHPTSPEYSILAETELATPASRAGNSGRPAVYADAADKLYAVWHDDANNGKRQLFFAEYSSNSGWSSPLAIVSDNFGSSNPDIAVDALGNVYVIYENHQSDNVDIGVIQRNSEGWGEPFIITNSTGDSLNPKVSIDSQNDVHVVWEDYRLGNPEIFYCRRNASNGQWESSYFGHADIQVSNSPDGARYPTITSSNKNVYIAWTSYRPEGTSHIALAMYDASSNSWISSGQGRSDFFVSILTGKKSGFPDISIDLKGQVLVVWHDIIKNGYQVFGRFINSRLAFAKPATQLTSGSFDSKFPKISTDSQTGNMYVVFERSQSEFFENLSPYDPYGQILEQSLSLHNSLYLLRWNAGNQVWESSNVKTTLSDSSIVGGFDVSIATSDKRISRRPSVPSKFTLNNLHILYETEVFAFAGTETDNNSFFTQIRDAIFETNVWKPIYLLDNNAYLELDNSVSDDGLFRKEIRFGNFSSTIGSRMVINRIRYYTEDAVDPFSIRLISSATVNMPLSGINAAVSNTYGDAWLGTDNGLMFYQQSTNKIFVLDSPNYNISGLKINCIIFDNFANMLVGSDDGLHVSSNHLFFWKITGINGPVISLATDGRNILYVGTTSGMITFDSRPVISALEPTSDDAALINRTLPKPLSMKIYNSQNGLPSNIIYVIKTDANNVAWIGTNKGLVRFFDGQISTFTATNGLSSNKINDIAIRNTGIRYLATTSGVDKMVGIEINKINFGNINTQDVGIDTPDIGYRKIPALNDAKAILWKDPNILLVATIHDIYQTIFIDESFDTVRTQITRYRSRDFTTFDIIPQKNDDLQTYKLVGLEDVILPDDCIFEVYLNSNQITRGFRFSPYNQVLRFEYPLLRQDIVQVAVRSDIRIFNNFSQTKAEQIALGNMATKIDKIVVSDVGVNVLTGGDVNTIQINDANFRLPFDKIVLDTVPPQGKIKIAGQVDRSIVRVNINKIRNGAEYLPFDATSGVASMIVSNFTNFTSDGQLALSPVPFVQSLLHDLGLIFDNVTKQFTIPTGLGRRITQFNRGLVLGSLMILGTANPPAIYTFDPIAQQWHLIKVLDQQGSVEFIKQYGSTLLIGTGSAGQVGKIFISTDGVNFAPPLLVDGDFARCAEELNGILYIGTGGQTGGKIYRYDGSSFSLIFDKISSSVYDLATSGNNLYAATGSNGRIYRFNPLTMLEEIVHVDSESNQISIAHGLVSDNDFIFVGGGTNATIKRSLLPDNPFIHSFKTVNAPVYMLKNLNGIVYAAIGKTTYALNKVWQAQYTHSEDIRDISVGLGQNPWFVSDSFVYKIGAQDAVKSVYLKLIDRAGNQTNLYLDTAQTQIDPNLFDSISLSQLVGFINTNRLLEIDEFGNTVSRIDGDSSFYSGNKIDTEVGVYYSEIFNGTNNLVSWDAISWDATIPSNTSLLISIRTASNKDDLLGESFAVVFDGNAQTSADISFLSGQYLQVKIVMSSSIRGMSPSLRSFVVKSISSESVHFFTTNFILPSRVTGGILTSQSKPFTPVAADIIFGIDTNNSIDFANYQIVDENRIFTTDNNQIGKNLRIGIRLLSPTGSNIVAEGFGEYGPYSLPLYMNAAEWTFTNMSAISDLYHFAVTLYEDEALLMPVLSVYSGTSTAGFSIDGNAFPSTGVSLAHATSASIAFTPVGSNSIICNKFYYVKITATSILTNITENVITHHAFVQTCGVSFLDTITFDFTNRFITKTFQFRIRFYDDTARTNLVFTAYSGNDQTGWSHSGMSFPAVGIVVNGAQTITVTYAPNPDNFDPTKIYYLSIDTFDGSMFALNSNSYNIRIRNSSTQVYCGEYNDVPVIKNVGLAFQLENGQMVTLQLGS